MSHHTDMRGAEAMADDARAELARAVDDLRGPELAERALNETCRNALVEFIIATRRNDPFGRVVRTLTGELGLVAKSPLVRALLLQLQADARHPFGVSDDADDDPNRTPVPEPPVNPIEVDARPNTHPTRPVRGPWKR